MWKHKSLRMAKNKIEKRVPNNKNNYVSITIPDFKVYYIAEVTNSTEIA